MKNDLSRRQQMTVDLGKQINRHASIMLQELIRGGNGKNVVFSPLASFTLLSMLADATSGKTKEEITKVLCEGNELNQLVKDLAKLKRQIEGSEEYSSANAVIVREDIHENLAPDYKDRLSELFGGRLFISDNLAAHLDPWVRKSTGGIIPSVSNESMKEMMLCMINACAFIADWQTQYEESAIVYENFHNADHTTSRVQMLHSYELTYVENEMFTGFAKPYKGDAFSYMVLLPKNKKLLFDDPYFELDFSKLIQGVDNTFAKVVMPEFHCSTDTDLTDIMKKLGIHTVFTPQADFSSLSSEWLKVGSIKHRAHIEVDRKGTKAAAVAYDDFLCGSMPVVFPEEKYVLVNRPFLFAVVHNATGTPVFFGAIQHLDAQKGTGEYTDLEE